MNRNIRANILTLVLFLAAALASAGARAQTVDIPYQGWLTQGELPCDGSYEMTFSLYNTSTGGTAVWSKGPYDVTVSNGAFSVVLDVDETDVTSNQALYLGITVEGVGLMNRQRIYPAVYAARNIPGMEFWVDNLLRFPNQERERIVFWDSSAGYYAMVIQPGMLALYTQGPADEPTMVLTGNGTVGIGTNQPQKKLHLVGDMQQDGNLSVSEGVTVGGTLSIGGRGIRRIIDCSYAGTDMGSMGGWRYHHWRIDECRSNLSTQDLPSGNCVGFITKAHSTYDDSDWRLAMPGETIEGMYFGPGGMHFWNQDGNATRIHIQAVYMCD